MSDVAPACPTCGWSRALAFAGQAQAAKVVQDAEGQKLVSLSTKLMALGFFLMLGGCGAGIGLKVPVAIGIGVGLGMVMLVVAAVVGQIGRAKQGRIV